MKSYQVKTTIVNIKRYGLVPDDIIHRCTNKRHTSDEKAPIFRCVSLHQSLIKINKLSHYTQDPFNFVVVWLKNKFQMLTEKYAPPFFSFVLLCFRPKKLTYLLLELSIFNFSWYTLKTNVPQCNITLSIE